MANEDFNWSDMGFDDIFKDAMKKDQPTIKDIADRFKEVLVKCPCCEHTIKFKVKV